MTFGEQAVFMAEMGEREVLEQVLRLADFLRWNETTISLLKESLA